MIPIILERFNSSPNKKTPIKRDKVRCSAKLTGYITVKDKRVRAI